MAWALIRLLPLLVLFVFVSIVIDPGRPFTGDERPIVAAAGRLLQGRYAVLGTVDPVQFLWHGPGLPALLAPLVALGVPLGGLRLTTPLLMFAAVIAFNRLLRVRLGRRRALVGAYALGLYVPSYYVFGTVAKEPLALLLSIIALDGTARYLRCGRRRFAAVAGLSLGALAMTRLEYGWVITLMLAAGVVWSLAARARHGVGAARTRMADRWALICLVGMLACLPWLTYTYAITGHLFYWGNSGGISLYWMSSPSSTQLGQWHSASTVFTDPALAGYRAFFRHLATLTPVRADLELQHVAIVQALAHPAKYALNVLANVGRMFGGFPFSFTLPAAAIAILIVVNGTLLAGLIAAAVTLLRRRSLVPREAAPFALFAAVAFGIHVFPTAEPRMLVPIIPVPIWLIGQAVKARRRAPDHVQRPIARASLVLGPRELDVVHPLAASASASAPPTATNGRAASFKPGSDIPLRHGGVRADSAEAQPP